MHKKINNEKAKNLIKAILLFKVTVGSNEKKPLKKQ